MVFEMSYYAAWFLAGCSSLNVQIQLNCGRQSQTEILKKKTRALDCPMPLWNYAEMGGPDRYNENLIKHKHLKSQQKSRPAKNFIVDAPEEGGREAAIFSFGTLLNIPKAVAVVCIQPHKNLVEKSDVRSHHPTRDFLLGYLAST